MTGSGGAYAPLLMGCALLNAFQLPPVLAHGSGAHWGPLENAFRNSRKFPQRGWGLKILEFIRGRLSATDTASQNNAGAAKDCASTPNTNLSRMLSLNAHGVLGLPRAQPAQARRRMFATCTADHSPPRAVGTPRAATQPPRRRAA
jgi:hypothetical protein